MILVSFEIELDIKTQEKLYIYLNYDKFEINLLSCLDTSMHLSPINNSYYVSDKYIITNKNNSFILYPYSKELEAFLESKFSVELKKQNKNYLIRYRKKLVKKRNNRPKNTMNKIWLINDYKDQAGDNGEYFFRYLIKAKPKHIDYYFIIEKNCSDYNRLKVYGNVVDIKSTEHLKHFLNADKIITSIVDYWVNNKG